MRQFVPTPRGVALYYSPALCDPPALCDLPALCITRSGPWALWGRPTPRLRSHVQVEKKCLGPPLDRSVPRVDRLFRQDARGRAKSVEIAATEDNPPNLCGGGRGADVGEGVELRNRF